jgi:hypothetical protein
MQPLHQRVPLLLTSVLLLVLLVLLVRVVMRLHLLPQA